MIEANLSEKLVKNFFEIIRTEEEDKKSASLQVLLTALDLEISDFEKKIKLEEGKIRDPGRGVVIQELMNEQGVYINLKTKLVVQLADAKQLREQQRELHDDIQ